MLQILRSRAPKPNRFFREVPRKAGEDNVAWLQRAAIKAGVRILLVGGRSHEAFRIRVAQAHARDDMTPSHWSGAALLVDPGAELGEATTQLLHVPLEPRAGLSRRLDSNGVEAVDVEAFRSARLYPNVAALCIEANPTLVKDMAAAFKGQRSSTDAIELAIAWLAFVCGVGRVGNPLLEGIGVPSAVFIESVLGAVGFELTPSLPNRSSCPEGIWQAVRWWHAFHAQADPATPGAAITGAWCVDEKLGRPPEA